MVYSVFRCEQVIYSCFLTDTDTCIYISICIYIYMYMIDRSKNGKINDKCPNIENLTSRQLIGRYETRTRSIYLFIYLSMFHLVYLSIYLFVYLFIYICHFGYLSIYSTMFLFISLSILLYIYSTFYLFIYLSFCLCVISLFICVSFYPSIYSILNESNLNFSKPFYYPLKYFSI